MASNRNPAKEVRLVPADTARPIPERLDLLCCLCRLFCRVYPAGPARTREMHHPSDIGKRPDASFRDVQVRPGIIFCWIMHYIYIYNTRSIGAQYHDEEHEERTTTAAVADSISRIYILINTIFSLVKRARAKFI